MTGLKWGSQLLKQSGFLAKDSIMLDVLQLRFTKKTSVCYSNIVN